MNADHRSAAHLDALLRQGVEHHRAGDLELAAATYHQILNLHPGFPDALHLLGLIAHREGRYADAIQLIEKAIRGNPAYEVYYSNLGNSLRALGQPQVALRCYEHAIALKPEYVDAHLNRGALLQEIQQYPAALESYDKVVCLQPDHLDAHRRRGAVLEALQRYGEAWESFAAVTRLSPQDAHSYLDCARVLFATKRYERAIESCDQALACDATLAQAHRFRGLALFELNRLPEAKASFEHLLALNPDSGYIRGMRFHVKQLLCDWEGVDSDLADIESAVGQGKRCALPLSLLSMSDHPALQQKAAQIYLHDECPSVAVAQPTPPHERIRVGYFSSDFRNHALGYLTAGLFERHDRRRFEIVGFSTMPVAQDERHMRIAKAMEHFVDVRSMSDADVVRLSRSLEIDIAVDLNGLSSGNRTNIFAHRAAPIQVNYLGYPGTMGAPFIDYLIADETLIPESHRQYYTEMIAYLPDTFQCTDPDLEFAPDSITRQSQGLPEDAFVYCCFNHNFKITPRLFEVWMRVLSRVRNSVLWLFAGNPLAQANLRKEAAQRGVSSDRLVFAQNLPFAEHLRRQQLADLFLDTLPFNAGATASPALWAGLPILTTMGESLAGRMAASLLRAVGMPDLIAHDLEAYEERAVAIGQQPELARELKVRLQHNRLTMPLFDADAFTRHMEEAFAAMHHRRHAGLPPTHLRVRQDPVAAESLQ